MNLYEQQARNRRRTWLVMAVFVGLVLLLGLGFDAALTSAQGAIVPIGTVAALLYGSSTAAYSYFNGDRAVLASTRAVDLESAIAANPAHLPYRQLQNVVDEMAIAAGLPRPRVYVIADQDPNALATGRDPGHAVICVTTGLLHKLDRLELEGVVAHELSHIGNYDILLGSLVVVMVGIVTLLSDWIMRSYFWGGRRRRDDERGGQGAAILLVAGMLLALVAPLIAQLVRLAISRRREFLADASGALITRYPKGLADALRKLDADTDPLEAANKATAHMYIVNPLKGQGGMVNRLFSTHPPIGERIRALERM